MLLCCSPVLPSVVICCTVTQHASHCGGRPMEHNTEWSDCTNTSNPFGTAACLRLIWCSNASQSPSSRTHISMSPETLAALGARRAAAPDGEQPRKGSDSIVLKSVTTGNVGSLKRPDFFAPCDVAPFRTYEIELLSMQDLNDDDAGNVALLVRYRALPDRANALVSVPVNVADLGKNHFPNVLAALTRASHGDRRRPYHDSESRRTQ